MEAEYDERVLPEARPTIAVGRILEMRLPAE